MQLARATYTPQLDFFPSWRMVDKRFEGNKPRSLILWRHSIWGIQEARSVRSSAWLGKNEDRWSDLKMQLGKDWQSRKCQAVLVQPDPHDAVFRRPNLIFYDFEYSDIYPILVDFENNDATLRVTLLVQMGGNEALTEQLFSKIIDPHECELCMECFVLTPARTDWPDPVTLAPGQFIRIVRNCRPEGTGASAASSTSSLRVLEQVSVQSGMAI